MDQVLTKVCEYYGLEKKMYSLFYESKDEDEPPLQIEASTMNVNAFFSRAS
jgi:hypothetical protein